jgi:hypothetical protein
MIMPQITLAELGAATEQQVREAAGIKDDLAVIHWEDPKLPCKIMVEAWPEMALADYGPIKRYFLAGEFWWGLALDLIEKFSGPTLRWTAIPVDQAQQAYIDAEMNKPSKAFLRSHRIWDLGEEPWREDRYLAGEGPDRAEDVSKVMLPPFMR